MKIRIKQVTWIGLFLVFLTSGTGLSATTDTNEWCLLPVDARMILLRTGLYREKYQHWPTYAQDLADLMISEPDEEKACPPIPGNDRQKEVSDMVFIDLNEETLCLFYTDRFNRHVKMYIKNRAKQKKNETAPSSISISLTAEMDVTPHDQLNTDDPTQEGFSLLTPLRMVPLPPKVFKP